MLDPAGRGRAGILRPGPAAVSSGVHSAAATEYDWPFYGDLVGAYFKAHPAIQPASVTIEVADHPATAGLRSPWMRTDEWYDFRAILYAAVRTPAAAIPPLPRHPCGC